MSGLVFACCDELRRNAIAGHATLNAIDYIEVLDLVPADLSPGQQAEYASLPTGPGRDRLLWQRRLVLHFVNPLSATHVLGLTTTTIRIGGGERIRDIRVEEVTGAVAGADAVDLRVSEAGDFSRYVLELVRSTTDSRPPVDFDPILSRIDFSFKVDCPSEFDCQPAHICLRSPRDEPEIDYLAKDYASFRRLIIDRLSLLVPDWRDRSAADLGIVLVELLAYVGDQLSYQQDAVATEAYLETARLRSSVRRHALLVDYVMHDGSNARAWLHVHVSNDTVIDASDFRCLTTVEGLPRRIVPVSPDERTAANADAEWFEPVAVDLDPDAPPAQIPLFADHNEFRFYTWRDDRCCLPAGAVRATLLGHHPTLEPGMILVFEEMKGPLTGDKADADSRHRHAVRLTKVIAIEDGSPLTDPLDGTAITSIAWDPADALPFPFCISERSADGATIEDVSVARGNIVLVDHGRTVEGEDLGASLPSRLVLAGDRDTERCDPRDRQIPSRYRPTLRGAPVTSRTTIRKEIVTTAGLEVVWVGVDLDAPATAAFGTGPRLARPVVRLDSVVDGDMTRWLPVRDLLNSASDASEFVVETEHDGSAVLRFGDDDHGRRPRTDEAFAATYRIGNGLAGNVGADAITHVISSDARIETVRNPLPARGGTDPETAEEARRRAPQAFRTQERAVTPTDYEAVTMRREGIQRAAATLRWTGSWHTVFLTVDRLDGRTLDEPLERELTRHVDRYRMAGHDLEFDNPRFVPLEVELAVCVDTEYFRADVKERLLEVLSNRYLPDGRRGLFHPDAFTFGQTIYLSPILAAARDVAGVSSATVTVFQRQGVPSTLPLADGRLPLSRLEIGRLDNDPDFPERGVLRLTMSGGK